MVVDLGRIRNVVAKLYTDLCDIYEYKHVIDDSGATQINRVLKVAGIRCRVSHQSGDDASQRVDSHIPLSLGIEVFFKPFIDLKAGDYLVITRRKSGHNVRQYRGTIGEPRIYDSHIQVYLNLDDAE